MTPKVESALIIEVAEADALVRTYRAQYDPSAAAGMPPHITLLYPFVAPTQIDEVVLRRLRDICSQHEPLALQLTKTCRFPDVLYLAPQPETPLKGLMSDIFAAFPDSPPYGGAFAEVIPHLTVAQVEDVDILDRVTARFTQEARDKLPLASKVEEVQLWDNVTGGWQLRDKFDLGEK